ncbi:protein L [Herbaspirillum rubrisubalbicans]|uniref:Protein L n=1 Tax=Herbaspirillum rubrisubalbicans TaxID=80842 RepID=A0AAD0UCA7_9BURK|nr:protein L [Herbaspirillum rubrisubalbicans]
MALYKNGSLLKQTDDKAFDALHNPGHAAPHPGIYRCIACGDEIAIAGGHVLPPQNHAQHSPSQGQIKWQLLVYPVQRK